MNLGKHSAVRSAFHRDFIHTNKIDKSFGRLYDELFHARQQGDYMPMTNFNTDVVKEQINDVKNFLKVIKSELDYVIN